MLQHHQPPQNRHVQARCTQLSTELPLDACLVILQGQAGWVPEVDGPDIPLQNHINIHKTIMDRTQCAQLQDSSFHAVLVTPEEQRDRWRETQN